MVYPTTCGVFYIPGTGTRPSKVCPKLGFFRMTSSSTGGVYPWCQVTINFWGYIPYIILHYSQSIEYSHCNLKVKRRDMHTLPETVLSQSCSIYLGERAGQEMAIRNEHMFSNTRCWGFREDVSSVTHSLRSFGCSFSKFHIDSECFLQSDLPEVTRFLEDF